jgi:hypothetical protein
MADSDLDEDRIGKLLVDRETMDRVMKESHARAIREHRAAGVPLVSSREGKVILVDPWTLEELPEDEAAVWLSGRGKPQPRE